MLWEAQPALLENVTQCHPMLENRITTAVAFRVEKIIPKTRNFSLFFYRHLLEKKRRHVYAGTGNQVKGGKRKAPGLKKNPGQEDKCH